MSPHLPALRVLIVDDDADAGETLRDLLESMGLSATLCADGAQGLSLARAEKPDVVLCDIGMPGMDGHEVARRLRADPELRAATLVALTGYGQPSDRQRSAEAGFDLHLVKPIDLEQLRAKLAALAPRPR